MINKCIEYNVGADATVRPNTKKCRKSNQKGITLIALIVTIIIMLILTSVTIEVATGNIENSKMVAFVTYMQTIQGKVDILAGHEDYTKYGEKLTNDHKNILQDILNSTEENFITTIDSEFLRYFNSNKIETDLDVGNVEDEIVVDFNTREVISLNGIERNGKKYYTQYYLPGGQTISQREETIREVSFEEIIPNINGLNATFTIKNIGIGNGTLSLGKKGSDNVIKWQVLTNYTKKTESFTTMNITESGTYYFKLVDNTTNEDNANSEGNYPSVDLGLTNEPKLKGNLTDLSSPYDYSNLNDSTKWAFATDKTDTENLKYYVWIPRFVYKLNDGNKLEELQFLRGVSDITTSGGYINTAEWILPTAFIEGSNEKTGVWVQVNSGFQTRHRYN